VGTIGEASGAAFARAATRVAISAARKSGAGADGARVAARGGRLTPCPR